MMQSVEPDPDTKARHEPFTRRDVVTGKLDVRAAAARLPDETDEPDPLDDAEKVEA